MIAARFFSKSPQLLPSLCVAVSGILWGLFWLPLRAFEDYGLKGAWPGLVVYCVCFVLLLPFLPRRWDRISPARVGILLMGEVVVGVGSAAFLSGEPFGLREALGTVLILSAAAVEIGVYAPITSKS